jgi:hypothetical protein
MFKLYKFEGKWFVGVPKFMKDGGKYMEELGPYDTEEEAIRIMEKLQSVFNGDFS